MSRPYTWDLHPSGAVAGQAPVYDGTKYVPTTVPTGTIPTTAGQLATAWVPLQTTVGGVPDLVWDGNDEIVLVEVPVP